MAWKQSQERNRRLKKLYNKTKYNYGSGAYFDSDKNRYVKYCPGSRTTHIKKKCNRRFRRLIKFIDTREKGISHKVTEYWYEVL